MVNFNQKSEQMYSIMEKLFKKHYYNERSSRRVNFQLDNYFLIYEHIAIRLGNPNYEVLVHIYSNSSVQNRVSSIKELEVEHLISEELFNNFYQSVINYKF